MYAEGLVKYFIPQNKLTYITPSDFVLEIMGPLGYKLEDYKTSTEFYNFIKDVLFPQLSIAAGHVPVVDGPTAPPAFTSIPIAERTNYVFGSNDFQTISYLINSLGLFQLINFQNNQEPDAGSSSAYWTQYTRNVAQIFTNKIYTLKEPVTLEDFINFFTRVIVNLVPDGSDISVDSPLYEMFTSGVGIFPITGEEYSTKNDCINKAEVWSKMLYGITDEEQDDTFVSDFLNKFFVDKYIDDNFKKEGLLEKFQKALGFVVGDIDNKILRIETLNSVENCPSEFLPYLADVIGWKLYGTNEYSWRRQLREARALLQKKGTREGLKDLLSVILPSVNIDFDNNFKKSFR